MNNWRFPYTIQAVFSILFIQGSEGVPRAFRGPSEGVDRGFGGLNLIDPPRKSLSTLSKPPLNIKQKQLKPYTWGSQKTEMKNVFLQHL